MELVSEPKDQFYGLQTASSNLSRTTFEPRPQRVVIDLSSISDTSLGDDACYKEEFEPEEAESDGDFVVIQACVESGLRPGMTGQRPVTTRALGSVSPPTHLQ